jgi:hypothetical protein
MIRFFKSSYIVQYSAILLTGLLLWGRSFFDPPEMPSPEGYVPLYTFLFSLLSSHPVLQVIAGFLLVASSAIILNRLLYSHNIVQKNTSLTAFVFMVLMSYYPQFLTIHPVNISIFILLVILSQLLHSYNQEEPVDIYYSTGFLTAIGSYVYFPFIFFYGFILISFIIFRSVKWREWVSSLLGLLTPFLFLVTWYFWNDNLQGTITYYSEMFRFDVDLIPLKRPGYATLSILVALFSLYALYNSIRNRSEKTIERTRKNLLLNWLVLFCFAIMPFASSNAFYHPEITFITFSGAVSFYLMQLRKAFWQELFFMFFIIFLVMNNLIFRWL